MLMSWFPQMQIIKSTYYVQSCSHPVLLELSVLLCELVAVGSYCQEGGGDDGAWGGTRNLPTKFESHLISNVVRTFDDMSQVSPEFLPESSSLGVSVKDGAGGEKVL